MIPVILSVSVVMAALLVCAVVGGMPKNRTQLSAMLNRWADDLYDNYEFYFESAALGLTNYAAWHSYHGYSAVRDRLTWWRYQAAWGWFAVRDRVFCWLDRLAEGKPSPAEQAVIEQAIDEPWYVTWSRMSEAERAELRSFHHADPGA